MEGDTSLAKKWLAGDTGKGRVIVWQGDLIPSQSYVEFLRGILLNNFIRGAVSGLGIVDVVLGLTELARFWRSFKIVSRTSTTE